MLKVVDLVHYLPHSKPNDAPLLDHLNCTILAGESVAIVGASGSGKTTLLSFLAGLDTPKAGKVLIAEQDITQMDEEARAKVRATQVAFVFQNFQLIDGLSALQNVCLPLEVKGVVKPEPQAIEWLERVGLAHRLNHKPTELSGGEQQRVALARAFACGAPLLFADEPTGSLDTNTGHAIADLLFELCSQKNQKSPHHKPTEDHPLAKQTLVLVTHDLNLAKRCDRILTLSQGRLIEVESVEAERGASSKVTGAAL